MHILKTYRDPFESRNHQVLKKATSNHAKLTPQGPRLNARREIDSSSLDGAELSDNSPTIALFRSEVRRCVLIALANGDWENLDTGVTTKKTDIADTALATITDEQLGKAFELGYSPIDVAYATVRWIIRMRVGEGVVEDEAMKILYEDEAFDRHDDLLPAEPPDMSHTKDHAPLTVSLSELVKPSSTRSEALTPAVKAA